MKLNSGGIKHPKETFQDAKRVIISCKSKKDRQRNDKKKKKDKKINNDLQYFTQKTKDHRVSRSPLKSMG